MLTNVKKLPRNVNTKIQNLCGNEKMGLEREYIFFGNSAGRNVAGRSTAFRVSGFGPALRGINSKP